MHCHKRHLGICRRVTGGCFQCGSTNHIIENCRKDQGFLEILKEVAKEDQMYLHRLMLEVEGEVIQDNKEEVLLQRQ